MALSDLTIRGLQDPPYKTPLIDQQGLLTPAWQRWINEVYLRIGGKQALSNVQIKTLLDELDVRLEAVE